MSVSRRLPFRLVVWSCLIPYQTLNVTTYAVVSTRAIYLLYYNIFHVCAAWMRLNFDVNRKIIPS